jgi:hypothetical protein
MPPLTMATKSGITVGIKLICRQAIDASDVIQEVSLEVSQHLRFKDHHHNGAVRFLRVADLDRFLQYLG